MRLGDIGEAEVHHDLGGSFEELLRAALLGGPVIAALGPLYHEDPAAELFAPFIRSAAAVGWACDEDTLAPDWALEEARMLRVAAASRIPLHDGIGPLVEWTRAGLVLELGARLGIRVLGHGILHPSLRLRGSVTGRFGYEGAPLPGGGRWNPMTIREEERDRVVPSGPDRRLATLDFRAMDLCSMVGLVPGLAARYEGAEDMHLRTCELLCIGPDPGCRDVVKRETFVHAYGGRSELSEAFGDCIPELEYLRRMPPGDAGRLVQERSAVAFRAALSRALPALVDPDCRPMFAVHDEITLDVTCGAEGRAMGVLRLMEQGASERTGVHHSARLGWGANYMASKGG